MHCSIFSGVGHPLLAYLYIITNSDYKQVKEATHVLTIRRGNNAIFPGSLHRPHLFLYQCPCFF
jgi:hypothetical protein